VARRPERERKRAIEEGKAFLKHRELVADADEGDSGLFSVLGHKADLLFVHFRPTLDDLSSIERRFEDTALANFTERTTSYVSVTEVSGYVSDEFFEDPESVDTGLKRYIEGKMTPEIPDDEYVCFYPMSKRRGEEYNWYDLSFEDRADLMADHGEVGKEYAGKIKQVIASSVGFDSHEWGVTLFGSDPTDIKDIVYEMRFDPASSRYGEFGEFYIGRRFPPPRMGARTSRARRCRRQRATAIPEIPRTGTDTLTARATTMPVPAADPHTATTPRRGGDERRGRPPAFG